MKNCQLKKTLRWLEPDDYSTTHAFSCRWKYYFSKMDKKLYNKIFIEGISCFIYEKYCMVFPSNTFFFIGFETNSSTTYSLKQWVKDDVALIIMEMLWVKNALKWFSVLGSGPENMYMDEWQPSLKKIDFKNMKLNGSSWTHLLIHKKICADFV